MFISLDILDAAIELLISEARTLHVCRQEPTNYNEAVSSALAEISIDTDAFMGPLDYYGEDEGDDVVGRIVVVTLVTGTGSADGVASHIALTGGSDLLCVVPCTAEDEVFEGAPLLIKDWCIVFEYAEGACVIPEEFLD